MTNEIVVIRIKIWWEKSPWKNLNQIKKEKKSTSKLNGLSSDNKLQYRWQTNMSYTSLWEVTFTINLKNYLILFLLLWKPNKCECDIIRDWWLIFGSAITTKLETYFRCFLKNLSKQPNLRKVFFEITKCKKWMKNKIHYQNIYSGFERPYKV